VTDSDLPAIFEAVAESGVEELRLGAAALSEAGVAEVLAFMAELPRPLRVDLAGCESVAALEVHLSSCFPYEQGCSLEVTGCGFSAALEEKLRNRARAEEARRLAAEARQRNAERVASYMKRQAMLEEFAADHCNNDQPPPLRLPLCHPARWQEGESHEAETEFKAYKMQNPEGLLSEVQREDMDSGERPLENTWTMLQKDGSSLTLGMDEFRALSRQKDDMLKDWGYEDSGEYEGPYDMELPKEFQNSRALPVAFENTFHDKREFTDLLGFMLWVGVKLNPDIVEEVKRELEERQRVREDLEAQTQEERRHWQESWKRQRELQEAEWREEQKRFATLSEAACRTYETEPQQPHRGSGQIIAHFTFICLGSQLRGNDPLMPHTHFGLKRICEKPRPKPRKGTDIHIALLSGIITVKAAIGNGFGLDALQLVFCNQANDDAEVAIPRGTIFQHIDWQHRQNLMVSIDYVVQVPAGKTVHKSMSAYCMNSSCACSCGNRMALTDFYLDDAQVLQDQMSVWDHFDGCFSKRT